MISLWATSSHAGAPPPEQALDGHLVWGQCRLEAKVDTQGPYPTVPSSVWPVACLKARVGSQVAFRDDIGTENLSMNYAEFYHGFHLTEMLSIHGRYVHNRLFRLNQDVEDHVRDQKYTDELFLQLGHVDMTKYTLALGDVKTPFGIDYRPLMKILDHLVKNNDYWRGPRWGAILGYNTLVSSQFEIGYLTDRIDAQTVDKDNEGQRFDEAVSFRMMFDMGALEGVRFVVSGYGGNNGQRRVGAGFFLITENGDDASFEWIRVRHTPDGAKGFNQVFRVGYASPIRAGTKSVAEYESEAFAYRMGTVGFDFILPDYGVLRMSASYNRGWYASQPSYMIIASAIQLAL